MEQMEVFTLCSFLFVVSFCCSVNLVISLCSHHHKQQCGERTARGLFMQAMSVFVMRFISKVFPLIPEAWELITPIELGKEQRKVSFPKTRGRHGADARLSCISLWKQKGDSVTLNQTGPDCPGPPAGFPFLLSFSLYLNYPGVNRQKHTRSNKTAGRKRFKCIGISPKSSVFLACKQVS